MKFHGSLLLFRDMCVYPANWLVTISVPLMQKRYGRLNPKMAPKIPSPQCAYSFPTYSVKHYSERILQM